VDIWIKLVSVLANWEFLVIVDWNKDFSCTNWLLVWVVELSNIWMFKSLFSSQSFIWVELK
jgi:hypothetical protein